MIDRLLQIHLEPVARDQRRWLLLRALTGGWLVAAGVGLLFVLLRIATGWTSPWEFVLLFGGALVWTFLAWQRNRRRDPDYNVLARKIEAENPRLHALLLTAIEQKPDRTTGELNYLQERVIREALAQDRRHGWHSHILKRLAFARLGNTVTLLLLVGVMLSLYRSAPPTVALFNLIAGEVKVTPGDTSIEKGSSLVVLARFSGDVPAEASLVVRPANEPERRIPLAKNLDDPVFGTSLPEINAELTYRVEYGGESSRDFKVTTFEYPRLERADAKVTFPEYTGLPEKKIDDTRRVSAVEGSTLDYTFHLNKPVASATLVAKDASQILLRADTNRPSVFALNVKVEKSQRYELLLVDEAGRTNKLPSLFVLEALTNRAPELKFTFPRGDQRVSALEEIAFKAETSDDFGLKAYGIAYNLAGQDTKFVELGQTAGAHEKRTFDHLVALEDFTAQPDQLLSYYLWADDIGPDSNVRRTSSDMFFAEVRPFEEIFREGQSPEGGAQQQQQQQRQNAAERLAELQKQIINATWNLQRRETGKSPSPKYKQDADVVKESQENALEQIRARREAVDDPRSAALIKTVEKEMEKAVEHLTAAADESSLKALPPALSSEQSAYQALLRLAAREYQVSRGQNSQSGQGGGGGARAQRQLDQLELKQAENRYETQRQAAPPQNSQQREQLQAFNRLKELAQRQQDVNERLKELQAALQEARTEAEREELRRRLKRLQEEQQQMLADVDELRQRMERPDNQSRMSEARQQLDQTRDEVQRASEAMERGEVSQALSSATRAQRDLQQMRDDFRKQNSSQFAEDMRELRSQARELAQKEEEVGQKLDALNDATQRKSLSDSDDRKELASQLDEQKQRIDELVKHATDVTEKAEPVEPLLSRQLYDTLRKAAQDDTRNLQETTNDLLSQGKMYRSVYERLRSAKDGAKKPVEVAADLLREGFASEANNLEQRARRSINELKDGVERAAQSVLGDDTEALRLARTELENLSEQLEREIAQARGQSNTNAAAGAQASTGERGEQQAAANGGERQGQGAREGVGQPQAQNESQPGQGQPGNESQQNGQTQGGSQPGQSQQASANEGQGRGAGSDPQADANRSGRRGGQRDGERRSADGGGRNGGRNFFDQLGGQDGGGMWGGPITGPEYTQWSDRLRDVEEMLDVPELRTEAARIRDRARATRLDLKRHSKEPQWDLVKMEIAGPLVELRSRISEELARRQSKEALVPIDRDPVPKRYSELVRRYYEQLGKSESAPAAEGLKQ